MECSLSSTQLTGCWLVQTHTDGWLDDTQAGLHTQAGWHTQVGWYTQ